MPTYNYTEADLKNADEAWAEAPAEEPRAPMGAVPRGEYVVRVEKAELRPDNFSPGNVELTLHCRIQSGQYAKQLLWPSGTTEPTRIKYLRQLLARCGFALERASQIPGILDQLIGIDLVCAVVPRKNDPSKSNTYVNRRVNAGDPVARVDTGDVVPF
jgi:hypothetical protein